jgi:hypothetical protein
MNDRSVPPLAVAFLPLAALPLLVTSQLGCQGGCHFNESSTVTSSEAASCVELAASHGSSDPDPDYPAGAGCVIPMLYGRNQCAAPLVFPAEGGLAELVVAPGARFEREVLVAPTEVGGRDLYAVPATVGGTAVVFNFSTNRL